MNNQIGAFGGRLKLPHLGARLRSDPTAYLSGLLLAALIIAIILPRPYLISGSFVSAKADAAVPLIFVAAGQTLVMLIGGFDLSVGGVVSVANSLAATQMQNEPANVALWMVIICFVGVGAGALNGFIVAVMRINPFIATLATWGLWSGVALLILPADGGSAATPLREVAKGNVFGIPASIFIVGAMLLVWVWFRKTRLGHQLYAVGSDERASFLSGVDIARVKFVAFVGSGLLASLAGIYRTVEVGSGSPTAGDGFILVSVAAVVVGGTRLGGGRGGIGLTVLGALILLLINDLVFFLGVGTFYTPMIVGGLLIVVVVVGAFVSGTRRGES